MKYVFLILFAFKAFAVAGQKLPKREQKIIAAVETNMTECMILLEKTVNINSGTLNAPGVKEVGMVMKAEFDRLGLMTTWISFPDSMKRAGHLFAEQKGTKGKANFAHWASRYGI